MQNFLQGFQQKETINNKEIFFLINVSIGDDLWIGLDRSKHNYAITADSSAAPTLAKSEMLTLDPTEEDIWRKCISILYYFLDLTII